MIDGKSANTFAYGMGPIACAGNRLLKTIQPFRSAKDGGVRPTNPYQ